ncbi:MAG: kinase, partial [Streptococcus parasanguinis]|nr:kinase [Streptococcus parasanguinis]
MKGTMIASCPGSCGELFQCVVDGREFLMSYGIEKKSQVVIGPQAGQVGEVLRPKMLQVMNELTDQIDFDFSFQTDISIGKGYSSSTADMLSILGAYSAYKHKEVSVSLLTSLCSKIEPSDSVGFSDWTVMNPLNGEIKWQTRWKPKLYVYILEPDQMVDTTSFIRMTDSPLYPAEQSEKLLTDF